MKFHQWERNCISQCLSKETSRAILPRHLGHNWGCMEHSIVRHTRPRLVCVRLSSRHTSLNYSALLAGSRGSHTSIFFNPSAVLSLVGFVLQKYQGWAIEYLQCRLGVVFRNTSLMRRASFRCYGFRTTNHTLDWDASRAPQRSSIRSVAQQIRTARASHE